MDSLVTGITTYVYVDCHGKLKAMADNRGVSLRTFAGMILQWASNKSIKELYEMGVDLPVYPSELDDLQGGDTA